MGNRSGARGGDGTGRGSRPLARLRPPLAAPRRATLLPPALARRARLRALVPEPAAPRGPAESETRADLSIDELLTGWLSSVRGVHEPDTLADCGDYARYLDDLGRARRDAEQLCGRLRERLAHWIDVETQQAPGPRARLTPSG
jgi:hypothetical protein